MNLSFPYRICKFSSIYYILIWINILDGLPLTSVPQNKGNLTDCTPKFETNVQQCLDGLYFYTWKTDVLKFQTRRNLFKEILKRFFCRQYTNSLQCIHEILDGCKMEETTRTVQTYLSEPWARQYNTFCDINQQNSSYIFQNNSIVSQRNLSNKTKLNTTVMHYTDNSTIKPIKDQNSEINRWQELQEKTEHFVTNDNQPNNGEPGGQQFTDPKENTREKVSTNTLFYSKRAKTQNSPKRERTVAVEYSILFKKLASKKIKFSMQTSVTDGRNYKPLVRNFEILMEIQ
ncbi:uncharacterized protein LOC123536406 [Mercenaria mercenaria]|uniref:uncharacterized protein LOC123536406 n=1 Tax=Mercenaria mercenaria TaxID=6596 RepID=UPI00234EE361|nr:uncharacterized protein LOC123536406 [Mercenaria mercenaria]